MHSCFSRHSLLKLYERQECIQYYVVKDLIGVTSDRSLVVDKLGFQIYDSFILAMTIIFLFNSMYMKI